MTPTSATDVQRVLLVEDDAALAAALVELLSPLGCVVDVAGTTAAGLRLTAQHAYAVCLLDYALPDGTGLELAKRARAEGGLSTAQLVFMTGSSPGAETVDEAAALGSADFLQKPLHTGLLKTKVRLLLELNRTVRTLATQQTELTAREAMLLDALQKLSTANVRRFESQRLPVPQLASKAPEAAREAAQVAVESLRRSEERYRLAARAADSVLWDWEVDAPTMFWSESLATVMGHPLPVSGGLCETAPTFRMENIHPDDRARVEQSLTDCLRARSDTWAAEYRFKLGSGEWAYVLDRSCVVRDPNGVAIRLVGALHDVSELRAQEAEARSRVEFQQQLIGIVSHDLRNPISAISLGATVMMQRGGLSESQETAVKQIVRASERASRMVRDLLDFTRARLGGGIPIQPKAADLGNLAEQVVRETAAANPQRQVDLSTDGELHGVWDVDRLAQVLTNLLGNALSYSPKDSAVRVSLSSSASEVTLSVQNGGTPIPPDVLPHIFEPMTRGDAKESGGSASRSIGLGLYIVQNIVRAHAGRVEVTSSAEKGTCFRVILPRHLPPPTQRGSGVFSIRALKAAQEARRARGG